MIDPGSPAPGFFMSVVLPIVESERYAIYTASAGQTQFAIPFPFQQSDDIAVLKRLSPGAYDEILPSAYVISGVDEPAGGMVTFSAGRAAGEVIVVLGRAVLDRLTSIVSSGKYRSELMDGELDRLIIMMQELARDLKLTVRVDFGATPYTYSVDLADGDTVMVSGSALVPGPKASDIEAAQAQAANAIAAASAATTAAGQAAAARDDAALYAASINPASFYTKAEIDVLQGAQDTAIGLRALASRAINAGSGLSGGGNMTADMTISLSVASQAEAEAGAENTKAMTSLRTKQQIDARLGEYTSSEISIVSGGAFSVTHSLGVIPKVQAYLLCKVAEGGYSVGQYVPIKPDYSYIGAVGGMALALSTTTCNGCFGSHTTPFDLVRLDTGAQVYLTNANWRLILRFSK